MKTGAICFGALSLAGLAAAQPHHRRHDHHARRQVEVMVTETDVVTATAPNVIVGVDADGKPLWTSYVNQAPAAAATAAATSVASAASVITVAASAVEAYSSAATTAASAATTAKSASEASSASVTAASSASSAYSASSAAASSSASASASSGSSSNSGYGISYSPYSGSLAANDVGCKTADEVSSDFDQITGYSLVRIYGTDCNQVANVLSVAKAKDMKVFAGVYDITKVEAELAIIVAAANGDWSSFHTIAIGNELVNSGSATVDAVVAAISTARTVLKAAGYTGKIVTVDTFVALEENPALCKASDYAAFNAHAFFDADTTAAEAGTWVLNTMDAVSSACGGMDAFVTESGWPTAGDSNGDAVPSVANQKSAISSIKSSISSNMILFTAFNDLWKAPGYLNVEQSWGMLN